MKVKIEVTAADIAAGVQRHVAKCPIALAVSRALGRPVETGGVFIYEYQLGKTISYRLPLEVADFVYKFDHNKEVKPFTFEVRIYDENSN